jgi:hypothetical protein
MFLHVVEVRRVGVADEGECKEEEYSLLRDASQWDYIISLHQAFEL